MAQRSGEPQPEQLDSSLYFYEGTGGYGYPNVNIGVYTQSFPSVLGEDISDSTSVPTLDPRGACFNCGDSTHTVSTCTAPKNRQLIDLSRQMFEFYRGMSGKVEKRRVHDVFGWIEQKLEWVDRFQPGKIVGEDLLDALGGPDRAEHGEWLKNMMFWGYPPGWVAREDPRLAMAKKIHGEIDSSNIFDIDNEDSDESILVINGDDDVEEVDISTNNLFEPNPASPSTSQTSAVAHEPQRWAEYPDTYFLWSLLPVYKPGPPLPPPEPDGPPPPPPPPLPSLKPAALSAYEEGSDMEFSDED